MRFLKGSGHVLKMQQQTVVEALRVKVLIMENGLVQRLLLLISFLFHLKSL